MSDFLLAAKRILHKLLMLFNTLFNLEIPKGLAQQGHHDALLERTASQEIYQLVIRIARLSY
jgi:hypothetical protein